jgi:CBS domain-containing protein
MSRDPVTLQRNDELSLADDLMRLGRIRHLPVLEDGTTDLVGVVSQRDLFRGAAAQLMGYGTAGQRKLMKTIPIKEVMNSDPVRTTPETPLAEAAQLMLEKKIGCLLVVEDDALVGILTEADFVELVAKS